jgi:hypothetical protein
MSSSAIDVFTSSVNPEATRIKGLPAIVLVFGGKLGNAHDSARQMFLNWLMVKGHPINELVRLPESFPDWDHFEGYDNLIDFERDAASLAKAIVLFSESAGSFAELGAFCMDDVLAERLFVVIDAEHYGAGSFIAHGPIKKIEHHHDGAVCVVGSIIPTEIEKELDQVADALLEKINSIPKTVAFDPTRQRDQFLLAADLVDLFGAITLNELRELMIFMGVAISRSRLEQVVKQIRRFELLESVEKLTKRFLVPPVVRQFYLDYEADKKSEAPPFDRTRFKMKYSIPWLKRDSPRSQAYLAIHPKGLV